MFARVLRAVQPSDGFDLGFPPGESGGKIGRNALLQSL